MRPFRTSSGALYELPGPRPSDNGAHSDAFEGFARTLLLAAFRLPHASRERQAELAAQYFPGLIAGPGGDWPRITGLSQPLVEAVAIAVSLLQTRQLLWDQLERVAQNRLVDYLLGARTAGRPDGNWMWFQVMIETFLGSVGIDRDLAAVDDRLDWPMLLRRGDGMWSDGGGARYDYHSSWALNFYPALWSRVDGDRRPELMETFRKQALDYRAVARRLIDSEGGLVLQGRSLIYRAAAVAGLWAPELFSGSSSRSDSEAAIVLARQLKFYVEQWCRARSATACSPLAGSPSTFRSFRHTLALARPTG